MPAKTRPRSCADGEHLNSANKRGRFVQACTQATEGIGARQSHSPQKRVGLDVRDVSSRQKRTDRDIECDTPVRKQRKCPQSTGKPNRKRGRDPNGDDDPPMEEPEFDPPPPHDNKRRSPWAMPIAVASWNSNGMVKGDIHNKFEKPQIAVDIVGKRDILCLQEKKENRLCLLLES